MKIKAQLAKVNLLKLNIVCKTFLDARVKLQIVEYQSEVMQAICCLLLPWGDSPNTKCYKVVIALF